MKNKIITDNYQVLLHYDEDILFCGNNDSGESIIGSILLEDYDNKYYRHVYSIIEPHTLHLFKRGEITYLDILKYAKRMYLVKTLYSGEQIITGAIFDDIPKDCLPTEDSFLINKNQAT